MSTNKKEYNKAYGIWTVTTEGDVEGRSTTQLGTYEGYLDEIAFSLAHKACYSLNFTLAKSLAEIAKSATKVSVQLNIDSGTWNMTGKDRVEFVRKMLVGRNISVKEGQYYASVILIDGSSTEEIARKERELKKQQALDKLTKEDRKLLGLEK